MILSSSLRKYQTFLKFATAICTVAVRALELYAAGSGFKAQWRHFLLRLNLIVYFSHKS